MKLYSNRPGYNGAVNLQDTFLAIKSAEAGNGTLPCTLLKTERKTLIYSQDMDGFGRVIVKTYCHRGPVNWIREKISRFRVEREFIALAHLASHNIPCSKPLFWSCGQCMEYGRYETLVTEEIPGSVPMNHYMKSSAFGSKAEDFIPLCSLLRRMHSAGLYHGSLMTLRNVLITPAENNKVGMYIIDTPRSMIFPYDLFGRRMAWFDLLDAFLSIAERLDPEQCKTLLAHYGLDKDLSEIFMTQLKHHHADKYSRKLLYNEFLLRRIISGVRRI